MADQDSKKEDRILEHISYVIGQMRSRDDLIVLHAVQAVRQILCGTQSPPIDLLIENGVVPLCVRFLDSNIDELQVEAAWVLTNIAAGTSDQTMTVVQAGAVPKFVHLLQSNKTLADHSAWALGNIAGNGPITRDIVLIYGAAEALLKLLNQVQPTSFLRNIVWLIGNLCRSKDSTKVQLMVPALSHLLRHNDIQILSHAAWAIGHATAANALAITRISAVIEADCLSSLIHLLDRDEDEVIVPALRSVGNIAGANEDQINAVLAAGVLPHMKKLLNDRSSNIVSAAGRILRKITAGNVLQIQAVIDAGIFEHLRNVLTNGDIRAKKEVALVVANLSHGGTAEQIQYLHRSAGILKPFYELILLNDAQLHVVVLKALYRCFNMIRSNLFAFAIDDSDTADILEKLNQLQLN